MGFTHNPDAFIHANVIHVNWLPYLFAYLWAFHPTPACLYGLIFAWNLIGGAFFTHLILRRLSPDDSGPKIAFALSVLAIGGLLPIMAQMAQFLLFAGPVILAVYYCLLTKKLNLFLLAIAALCLVSEDSAMVAIAFLAYILLLEPGRKSFAWLGACVAIPYTALTLFWMQPASRIHLRLMEDSTTMHLVKEIFHMNLALLLENLKSLLPALTLLPAFLLGAFLFGRPNKKQTLKIAGLALLPALPHWGESFVVGGAHHLLPVFSFVYLALLRTIGGPNSEAKMSGHRRTYAIAGSCLLFFAVSLRALAGHLPNSLRLPIYRLAGQKAKADTLERGLAGGKHSNRAVIAAALALPSDKSLSYLTNNQIPGFFLNRTDIWQFPDYFDLTDYLLIQKDAADAVFPFEPDAAKDLRADLMISPRDIKRNAPVTAAMIAKITETLVRKERTHKIIRNDEHVLILERSRPHSFFSPPETVGFGWLGAHK